MQAFQVTTINGLIHCYGHLVAMVTKACDYNLAGFEVYELHIWYTAPMRPISGVTCCYGHFVTMATKVCAYDLLLESIGIS